MWPFTKKPTVEKRVQIIPRDVAKLRLSEWQQDSKLVAGMIGIMNNDYMRLAMDVLRNEHPLALVLPLTAPPDVRAAQQARAEGYTMAIANLEAMAHIKEPTATLEPTFANDDEQPTEIH